MSESILLVDDDVELCALMRQFFSGHGIALETASDGARGLARAIEGKFDLVLLDVMLPVLDGFDVLRQLRRRSNIPVIMLTARTEQTDRITGLDAGADDYLPKPFGPDELLARIRAVLRRTHGRQRAANQIGIGPVSLDIGTRVARLNGNPLDVTSIEFDILEFLVRAAGRVVSRDELTAALHQRESTPFERSLDVHVSHLRKKLEDSRDLIQTVRGVGYLFRLPPEDRP